MILDDTLILYSRSAIVIPFIHLVSSLVLSGSSIQLDHKPDPGLSIVPKSEHNFG